ncbi:LCP family protein [Blastococcus sp. SYSU D00669]
MTREREARGTTAGGRPLPARLDPRAGRPARRPVPAVASRPAAARSSAPRSSATVPPPRASVALPPVPRGGRAAVPPVPPPRVPAPARGERRWDEEPVRGGQLLEDRWDDRWDDRGAPRPDDRFDRFDRFEQEWDDEEWESDRDDEDVPERGFGKVLGLTVLGAVLPGSAFVAAGRRKLGWTLIALVVLALAAGAWLATAGRSTALHLAVDPTALFWVTWGAVALAVAWALVVIAGYRMLAPASTSRGRHVVGGLLVTTLALGVAAPVFEVAHLSNVQRNLLDGLFADGESATVPEVTGPNPWADKPRVNVLLLGGDGGDGREGVRTDTVMVASIDTATGATDLFSLPRNLEELPFPEDSPLHDVYPDGFDAGSESESLLNAVYRNGPAMHPDILGPTDNPGADFLKLGVGEALGLDIDYYVLVNLEGFSQLIDALGGITVNVNYWVPVGGEPSREILPDDYIAPGPNQLMDGPTALAYARGRFGLTDYLRMERQRCMIDAIVDAADPMTLLSRYQQLAATTQDIISTDIPQEVVGDFVDLALKVKDAGIQSVVFDDTVIRPAYPDFDLIRSIVASAIGAAPAGGTATGTGTTTTGTTGTTTTGTTGTTTGTTGTASTGAATGAVDDAADACAYDPVAAQEALDEGKPPTKRDPNGG